MDLLKVMERFPDQESCITHLEKIRWKGKPHCPHCGGTSVKRRKETKIGRIGRWNCPDCPACFKATCHTVFHVFISSSLLSRQQQYPRDHYRSGF